MREGELPLPLEFQNWIFMVKSVCDLNLGMICLLASKWQDFKVGMSVFQLFYEVKLKSSKFKVSPL